jgi:outer membrane protein insertion porin family
MRVLNQSNLARITKPLRMACVTTTSAMAIGMAVVSVSMIANPVMAQSTTVTGVSVEGNKRIATSTILSLAALTPGTRYSAGQINAAVQRLNASGFFKTVDFEVRSGRVTIVVDENPTINRIAFEGNKKLKDDDLKGLISSQPRQTFSAKRAEADAQEMAKAYSAGGRIDAQITPRLIERSDNRVDLVFQVVEGRVTEIEKITFVGNRNYSQKRLRTALATKQAGLIRALISSDTFIQDRLELDKQRLREFYLNRGFIDFSVLSTSADLTRNKDAFLLNFTVEEGQQYKFGEITLVTTEDDIDIESYQKVSKIKAGRNYDPRKIENLVQELDIKLGTEGFAFVSAHPRISRDDETRTLDVEIELTRGQRLFVERIDIEGNSTTLDRVIRRQFELAEGDAFNRREIQEATDRIRATGLFENVSVESREGSSRDRAIIDVNVKEKATGNLGIGAGYSSSDGFTLNLNLEERNFLGRGQTVRFDLSNNSDARNLSFSFSDPSFLDRDLQAGFRLGYRSSSNTKIPIDTTTLEFAPNMTFPVGKNATMSIGYRLENEEIKVQTEEDTSTTPSTTVDVDISPFIASDAGKQVKSSVIFGYNFDRTNSVIEPTAGFKFGISQQFTGLGGEATFSKTSINFKTYTTLFNDDIILSAELDAGAITGSGARISDRFFLGGDKLRGFEDYGVGPRDVTNITPTDATSGQPLGGNMYAVARLEASFPIGLPEEYGIFGGVFLDAGSVWGLDGITSADVGTEVDSPKIRAAAGVSIFWKTAIGPLRFNFSRPIKKEVYDIEENFRFTIDTRF